VSEGRRASRASGSDLGLRSPATVADPESAEFLPLLSFRSDRTAGASIIGPMAARELASCSPGRLAEIWSLRSLSEIGDDPETCGVLTAADKGNNCVPHNDTCRPAGNQFSLFLRDSDPDCPSPDICDKPDSPGFTQDSEGDFRRSLLIPALCPRSRLQRLRGRHPRNHHPCGDEHRNRHLCVLHERTSEARPTLFWRLP